MGAARSREHKTDEYETLPAKGLAQLHLMQDRPPFRVRINAGPIGFPLYASARRGGQETTPAPLLGVLPQPTSRAANVSVSGNPRPWRTPRDSRSRVRGRLTAQTAAKRRSGVPGRRSVCLARPVRRARTVVRARHVPVVRIVNGDGWCVLARAHGARRSAADGGRRSRGSGPRFASAGAIDVLAMFRRALRLGREGLPSWLAVPARPC